MKINRRKIKFYRRKINYVLNLSIIMMIFTLGYAFLTTTVNINGTGYINRAEWNVHFTNVQVKSGSVVATTAPTISNNTSISFAAVLDNPGDFYEFTVDIENTGTIPAMIDSFSITPTLTSEQANYFEFGVTYLSGISIANKQLLEPNQSETIRIYFKYKELENNEYYPIEDQNFQFNLTINYSQADNTAVDIIPAPSSFATDSWQTIKRAVERGNTSLYTIGSTKSVDMGTFGTLDVRVVNNSNPNVCETEGFSQTACGFVIEFADFVTKGEMNSTKTNAGGWPASELRAYLNNTVYYSLPQDLQDAIIDTFAVSTSGCLSGYNSTNHICANPDNNGNNFTSIDKLYLLSSDEIYGPTSYSVYQTRQLDFYASFGNNIYVNFPIKGNYNQYYDSDNDMLTWWLRDASSSSSYIFHHGTCYGSGYECDDGYGDARIDMPISPAFRIG